MIIPAIFFLCGNLLLLYWPGALLPIAYPFTMAILAALSISLRRFSVALLPLGFIWAWCHAADHLSHRFPDHLVSKDIIVQGKIISLPEKGPDHLRFLLQCEQWQPPNSDPVSCAHRLRLNWYYPKQFPRIGERWELTVRLKPPLGFMNPGSFDYEKWLFQQRISATGYVHNKGEHRLLEAARHSVHTLRASLAERLSTVLQGHEGLGGVLALSLGIRYDLETEDWQRYQTTGTSHLVAISGLHVGLISLFGMAIGRFIWSRSYRLTCRLPAQQFGLLIALVLAMFYAALAGFSIPTQRALVMIATLAISGLLRRDTSPWQNLALALILVITWDPFSVLDIGFWLSFSAVGFIFVLLSNPHPSQRWWQGAKIALILSLAMFPLTQLFFQTVSLVSPLANWIAVPWVSMIILPLCLLGTTMITISSIVGEFLLQLAASNMVWLNQLLDIFSQLPFSRINLATPSGFAVLLALVGVLWLLSPGPIPVRKLGLLLILPSFIPLAEPVPHGVAQVTLLDVGQGLSAVIETHEHTLVYDTGPRYPSGFNTGDTVVLPFLRSRQIEQIDRLVISHGDNDHIGGAQALDNGIAVFQVHTGVTGKINWRYSQRCNTGQSWQWDGVIFQFLHPPPDAVWQGNDGSCVLKITANGQSLLLPGDIEARAERALLSQMPDLLQADVLVAPHHGSRSSSSAPFIALVAPDWALFPAAKFNRYRFPAQTVQTRYTAEGISTLSTGQAGAIGFRLGEDEIQPESHRQASSQIWRYQHLD